MTKLALEIRKKRGVIDQDDEEEKKYNDDDGDFSDKYMNFVSLGLSTYDYTVSSAIKKLKDDIKPTPATKDLVVDLFDVQNIRWQ